MYMTILFCDIDNTILKTSEFYIKETNWLLKKLKWLPEVNNGIVKIVKNELNYDKLIFLSHRKWILYPISYIQMRKVGFSNFKIIHTSSAQKKIIILKKYLLKNKKILYIDDLSHNKENGQILFYHELINEIKKMNIKYYDYDWIEKSK